MNPIDDHIDVGDFDREYSLEELFSHSLAEELLADIDGRTSATILLPGGGLYYTSSGRQEKDYRAVAAQRKARPEEKIFVDGDRCVLPFDLVHELETVGTLLLEAHRTNDDETDRLYRLGRFTAGIVNRMMDLNYRNRMTAGLHGQVVSDSYTALKEKAGQLARSEARYRRLAEDLEIEVEKKTREIRETHLAMLQQEKMAAIGQLAAGMAHEINNPIGFIISNLNSLKTASDEMAQLIGRYRQLTDLLAGKTGDGSAATRIRAQMDEIAELIMQMDLDFLITDTAELIDESLDGAKRIKIIVGNLRDFTHPSVDSPENVNFNDCLETTLAMLSGHQMPEVTITRDYGTIPEVSCRLRELNQVFFNILKNAYQAVGERGDITIRTTADNAAVLVAVTDTGVGITASDQADIFNPFFTTREVGDGTGLGLFHAFTTVKALGGTIAVESSPGQGSTFTVSIPRTCDSAQRTGNAAAADNVSPRQA